MELELTFVFVEAGSTTLSHEKEQKHIEGSLKIGSGPTIQTTFGEGFRLRLSLFPQLGPISIQCGSNKTQNNLFQLFFILFMLRLLYETSNIIQYSNIPAS